MHVGGTLFRHINQAVIPEKMGSPFSAKKD